MHPILFTLPGGVAIHTYGASWAVGGAVVIFTAAWLGKKVQLKPEIFYDMGLLCMLGAVVGSRAEYVRTHWDQFAGHPASVFNIRDGGVVFYGGLISTLLLFIVYFAYTKHPAWRVLDVFSPLAAFGHGIGRLGCFAAGCCFGDPTSLPWGITFPSGGIPPSDMPLHPTQLYAVAYNAALGAFLLWYRGRQRFDGEVFLLYLGIYPLLRSLNEVVRGDVERGWAIEGLLTNAQATSVLLAALIWSIWLYRWRRSRSDLA